MIFSHTLLYALLGGLFFGSINSYYWYTQGYRGGRLFFLGTLAFFAIIMMGMKLFSR